MEGTTLQELTDSTTPDSAERFDLEYDQYLEDLVFQSAEHMLWYDMGFVGSKDFTHETVDDVYNNNLYCMSWFYNGALLFDTFEIEYENWLAEQLYNVMLCE